MNQENQPNSDMMNDIINLVKSKLDEAQRWEIRNLNDGYLEPSQEWGLLAKKYKSWIEYLNSIKL